MKAWILYENEDWLPPLTDALDAEGVPFEAVFVAGGALDLGQTPPEGVFINRMSPSSHTRGHQGGVYFMREYLTYLEAHGRRILNGSRAFELEVSKVKQDIALRRHGIDTPHTIGVVGRDNLVAASRKLEAPFITKHNQGGKGLGIQLYRSHASFAEAIESGVLEDDPGGVFVLQQYIEPPESFITRVEIVGREFQYAIASSTADGFELCPAQACQLDDQFCPVGEAAAPAKFRLRDDVTADDRIVGQLMGLMDDYDIDIAGVEFVEDRDGKRYVYDINTTTNYNPEVEAQHGFSGMRAQARLAKRELEKLAARAA
jgi:glutathione synthase/RimK-type ligase-like ATP-grasp enzyme